MCWCPVGDRRPTSASGPDPEPSAVESFDPELHRPDSFADFPNEVERAMSVDTMETTDIWFVFDRIMLLADRHDAFLIDLSGQVTLEATETAEVLASVEGIEGEVVIRMTESPDGNWRVHQVIVPDGDEEVIPWSVPDPSQ